MERLIITVDGPAGVGKSSTAKALAQELGIAYLDTGAMYRSIGVRLGPAAADMSEATLASKLRAFTFSLHKQSGNYQLFCGETPVGEEIRTERAGRLASLVGALPPVRTALQRYQREIGSQSDIVAEGRDMGSRVFPNAPFKFFLDARPEVRAQRRFLEMQAKGDTTSFEEILQSITLRDKQDRERSTDPLVPAPDAVLVDTSDLSPQQVLEGILNIIQAGRKKSMADGENIQDMAERFAHAAEGLARAAMPSADESHAENPFSHLAADGTMRMVAVEHKQPTLRTAKAEGFVHMNPHTLELLRENALPKGDVLAVAKVAGIMAAKKTADLIPLCHPLLLSFIDVNFEVREGGVYVTSEVRTRHETGVEMESLIAVQIACATIYDMAKAVQKDMIIDRVRLLYKEGGKTLYQAKNLD